MTLADPIAPGPIHAKICRWEVDPTRCGGDGGYCGDGLDSCQLMNLPSNKFTADHVVFAPPPGRSVPKTYVPLWISDAPAHSEHTFVVPCDKHGRVDVSFDPIEFDDEEEHVAEFVRMKQMDKVTIVLVPKVGFHGGLIDTVPALQSDLSMALAFWASFGSDKVVVVGNILYPRVKPARNSVRLRKNSKRSMPLIGCCMASLPSASLRRIAGSLSSTCASMRGRSSVGWPWAMA